MCYRWLRLICMTKDWNFRVRCWCQLMISTSFNFWTKCMNWILNVMQFNRLNSSIEKYRISEIVCHLCLLPSSLLFVHTPVTCFSLRFQFLFSSCVFVLSLWCYSLIVCLMWILKWQNAMILLRFMYFNINTTIEYVMRLTSPYVQ